ncbi:MAG: ABC transporter substrate-binding protein, partial [Desulfobacterales bacterium]|nr:ABC transporter substrate-binding protein [Desulfobacterales bacterium]
MRRPESPRIPRVIVLILSLALCACDTPESLFEKRADKAIDRDIYKKKIVIGVVKNSRAGNLFREGVELAVTRINEQGGALGAKFQPIYRDDMGDVEKGLDIAREMERNPDVVAVVGHGYSSVAIPASIIYERAGVVFISYRATDPALVEYGGEYTFSNILSEKEISRAAAKFARQRQNVKSMAILFERKPIYKTSAESFAEEAVKQGVRISYVLSYFPDDDDFSNLTAELKDAGRFDAIFIAGNIHPGVELIRRLRAMGIRARILAGNSFDTPELWEAAGAASEGVVVSTFFNPHSPERVTKKFVDDFKKRYGGREPDVWAAQGYDAMYALKSAIEIRKATAPAKIASSLRFIGSLKGVAGKYTFTPKGNITDKTVFFKEMRRGVFHFLDADDEVSLVDYDAGDTLRLPLKEPVSTIDPGFARDMGAVELIEQLFLGLTELDPETLQATPGLAREWECSEEGRRCVFHLRRDAVWTNGDPVTAHDVVWAVHRNLHLQEGTHSAGLLDILENAEEIRRGEIVDGYLENAALISLGEKDDSKLGARALDKFTVEFRLKRPAPHFPAIASFEAFLPLHRTTIETHGDRWTAPGIIRTSGPYRLSAWERGEKKRPAPPRLTVLNPGTHEATPSLALRWYESACSNAAIAPGDNGVDDSPCIRFDLSREETWPDGEGITAHDVVRTIHYNLAPETKYPYAYLLYILKNARAIHQGADDDYLARAEGVRLGVLKDTSPLGVRATNDFTVEFQLAPGALDRQEPPDESPGPPESDPVETGGEQKAAEALGRLGIPGESPGPPESDPVETGGEQKAAEALGRLGPPGESPGPPESDPVETGGEQKAAGPDEITPGEMEIKEIDREESIRKKFQREVLAFPARAGLCAYQPAPRDAGDGRPFGRSGA